jgi:DNA-binding SARP family transcriptional activator
MMNVSRAGGRSGPGVPVSSQQLSVRVLGELEVERGGAPVALPPSKKTRALLAYLALSGRPHRRERLCTLFWDVADDPRGALRWSLSRLRAVLGDEGVQRIVAARDSVRFERAGCRVDLLVLRERASAGFEAASVDELRALAAEFRGEPLEGLDLSDEFEEFQAWCVAEREEARRLKARLLRALLERLQPEPDVALPYARALASAEPRVAAARAGLVRLLLRAGRRDEAQQQYEAARRLLGEPADTAVLEAAWRSERADALPRAAARVVVEARAEARGAPDPPLVGRAAERSWLAGALEGVASRPQARVALLGGEPGSGKSRLLRELGARAAAAGGTVLEGRSYEVEAGRPYAPWRDALRRLPPQALGELAPRLAPVLPELGPGPSDGSREQLFAAVVEVLAARARSAAPVLLAFDDAQWLDPSSAELLHYVARTSRHEPLLVALAARDGELHDNEAAQRLVRGLRQLELLDERRLEPLAPDETAELVRAVAPDAEAGRIHAESAGNPLYALFLARSLGDGEALHGSLVERIRQRVERLPPDAAEALRWAAVLGEGFALERLQALSGFQLDRLLPALEALERHGLLRAAGGPGAAGGYAFTQDVVRRAVYGDLSAPRRSLMHLRIARLLEPQGDAQAGELARHAALAGETGLAARACVAGARQALRVFASEDALALARRGRRLAESLPVPERTERLLELAEVELAARRPADAGAAARALVQLAERALDEGRPEHARLGYHLLSWLRWEEGQWTEAQRHALHAERVARAGSERDQVVAMAEAARCLALLERDLPQAEALALEAGARSERAGVRPSAIADAQGMLRQHEGRTEEAALLFEQARVQARQEGDRMAEFQALEHLVGLRQQLGEWDEALRLCGDLVALGGRLRGGSEAAFARAAWALSCYARGELGALGALEGALDELRALDAKHRLTQTLTRTAALELGRDEAASALRRAEEALAAAEALGRPSETLLAAVVLSRACARLGDEERARDLAARLQPPPRPVSAAAREAAASWLAELDEPGREGA